MDKYISFDRIDDLLASLEAFDYAVSKIQEDPKWLKAAITSMHSSLQAALTISLLNGNGFTTWKEAHFKKWMEAYEGKGEYIEPQLDYFVELYKKRFPENTVAELKLMTWLNEVRNKLIHFNTDSLAICTLSAKAAFGVALQLIEKCPDLAEGIFFYESEQENNFEKYYSQAKNSFEKLLID